MLSKKDIRSKYIPDWSIQFLISIFLCTSNGFCFSYLLCIVSLLDNEMELPKLMKLSEIILKLLSTDAYFRLNLSTFYFNSVTIVFYLSFIDFEIVAIYFLFSFNLLSNLASFSSMISLNLLYILVIFYLISPCNYDLNDWILLFISYLINLSLLSYFCICFCINFSTYFCNCFYIYELEMLD